MAEVEGGIVGEWLCEWEWLAVWLGKGWGDGILWKDVAYGI